MVVGRVSVLGRTRTTRVGFMVQGTSENRLVSTEGCGPEGNSSLCCNPFVGTGTTAG